MLAIYIGRLDFSWILQTLSAGGNDGARSDEHVGGKMEDVSTRRDGGVHMTA